MLAILLCVQQICISSLSAQIKHWRTYSYPTGGDPVPGLSGGRDPVPYFLNPQIGFIYGNNGIGRVNPQFDDSTSHLSRTLDGAINWKPIIFFDTGHCRIKQLYFTSINHGYAASSRGIYETFDTGSNWKRISSDELPYCSVYAAGTVVFTFGYPPDMGTFGKFSMSTDDGKSWNEVFPNKATPVAEFDVISPYVFGNKDSLVFAETYDNSSFALWVSKDLGKSWASHHLNEDPQGLFCFPHCNRIVGSFEPAGASNPPADQFTIETSDDYGLSWNPILSREIGQWFAGNNCALYVSDANEPQDEIKGGTSFLLGPMRSTDRGKTWDTTTYPNSMKWGPEFNEIDDHEFVISINQKIVDNYILDWRNLSVVGYGAIIYAGDCSDSLWKSTDGGDGALSIASLAPHFTLTHNIFQSATDTFDYESCHPDSLEVYSLNIGCAYSKFDSLSIVGLDPSEYSVISTHYCSCQPIPDTSFITLHPHNIGTRAVTVRYHFTDDEYNQIDTSLQFVIKGVAGAGAVPFALSFQSASMNASPGDTISVPIYLSGTATLGATSITLPFGIDTNLLVPVGFQPAMAGVTVGSSFYSAGTETVPLRTDSNFSLNGQTLIGYLRCVVYVTDTLSTAITLTTASLNSTTAPCVALSLATDTIAVNVVGCGTKVLQQALLGNPVTFGIQRIVPNPATNEITIVVAGVGDHHAFVISDPLGRHYDVPTTPQPPPWKGGAVTIDISSLPKGVYFVSDGVGGAKFVKE